MAQLLLGIPNCTTPYELGLSFPNDMEEEDFDVYKNGKIFLGASAGFDSGR